MTTKKMRAQSQTKSLLWVGVDVLQRMETPDQFVGDLTYRLRPEEPDVRLTMADIQAAERCVAEVEEYLKAIRADIAKVRQNIV